MIVTEEQFRADLQAKLLSLKGSVKSVIGSGRSGAIASVYASHFLKIPWLPPTTVREIPEHLKPVLVIDTAVKTGATLRKLANKVQGSFVSVAIYNEPPLLKFWYEFWGDTSHENL